MKRQISVLDQSTIDKIAAGEVVERPSSVVKELVENAIDAGASAITVEIKEGGTTFIRITDNGTGIEKEQVPLAFLRHATSKIRKVEDLSLISSLGFRGEALSSIAAVSRVELITKPHEQLIGVRYQIEGGMEKGMEEIGAPDGTTFLIRDLFYNTPARAKFLKTPTTEAGYISSFIEQLALSHPHISFKYMQNGQTKLHTSGNNNLKEAIYQIYGRDITRELIEIHTKDRDETIRIDGFIGNYQQAVGWLGKHKGKLGVVVIFTFLQRCSVFVLTYMVYLGFGQTGSGALKVILLQASVYIAVDMLPLPGAQGITELMYQAVFAHVFAGAYLIPSMLVSRGINFYFLLILSLAVVLVNRFIFDRRRTQPVDNLQKQPYNTTR